MGCRELVQYWMVTPVGVGNCDVVTPVGVESSVVVTPVLWENCETLR